MDTRETALQVARIPVLLLLVMWVAPGIVDDFERASNFARLQDVWVSWVTLSFLSLAFVLIVLTGRHRWHPWALLGVEVVVTAVLAFVPPFHWASWFEVLAWTRPGIGFGVRSSVPVSVQFQRRWAFLRPGMMSSVHEGC